MPAPLHPNQANPFTGIHFSEFGITSANVGLQTVKMRYILEELRCGFLAFDEESVPIAAGR